jgi:hypothetical protein
VWLDLSRGDASGLKRVKRGAKPPRLLLLLSLS